MNYRLQQRHILFHYLKEQIDINLEIVVYYHIPCPHYILPRYLRITDKQ